MISSILKKYRTGHERSLKAKKNIAAAVLIKGGSILINLGLVPLTIDYITPSEYGIWLTLSSIIIWFSFFDIGLGHGLRNKLAEALAVNDKKLARIYISTTYAILGIVVCFVWLIFFGVNNLLNWSIILNAPKQMGEELNKVAILIFSFFCLQFVLRLLGTILTATQQPAKSSLFDFLANLLSLITIFLLSKLNKNGSLLTLAFVTGAFQILVLFVASLFFFGKSLREYRPSVKFVNFGYARSLMGLGIKFFVIQIAGIFVFQCTNIIITQLMGPLKVTVYNIAYRYFAIATMISGIVTVPFWSAFTEAYIKDDFPWMKSIVKKLNLFFIFISIAVVGMFTVSGFAYKIWIGDKVTIPWSVSLLMAINMILTIRWNLFILLINGTGKVKLQLLLNIGISFLFIPLAIFLGNSYELSGVVFANLLINLVYAILVPIQSNKILNQTATGIWNQ
jgi:O-antigen/teichoic acid export membrane protein